MSQFFAEFKIILLFFAFLTGATVYSLFESDLHHPVAGTSSTLSAIYGPNTVQAAELVPTTPVVRQLASVETNAVLEKKFFCEDQQTPDKHISKERVLDHLVMINFNLCRQQLKPLVKEFRLENQSNGFKAQIFKFEDGSYKTDYIQLNQGLNKLQLEVVLKDGQKLVESLEILSGS